MAGASLEITVRDSGVRELLGRIMQRLGTLRPAMSLLGEIAVESVQRNFEEHRSPEGTPWQALSARYARWKTTKKGRSAADILILDRTLMGSIHPEVQDDRVLVGTNVVYSRIHQLGGKIEKSARRSTVYFHQDKKTGKVGNRFVKAGKSNIARDVSIGAHAIQMPARPYLGLREEDWPRMRDALTTYILG